MNSSPRIVIIGGVAGGASAAARARRTACANSLDELLFALIVLGDDRLIERTVISQALLTIAAN